MAVNLTKRGPFGVRVDHTRSLRPRDRVSDLLTGAEWVALSVNAQAYSLGNGWGEVTGGAHHPLDPAEFRVLRPAPLYP